MKSDFHQPCHYSAFAAIVVKPPANVDKGLLSDIRRLSGVPGQAESKCNDFRPVGSKQAVERRFALSTGQ